MIFFKKKNKEEKATIPAEPAQRTDLEDEIRFSQEQVAIRNKKKKKDRKDDGYETMIRETGLSRDELKEKLSTFRKMQIADITLFKFRAFGLYKMSEKEARDTLFLMAELDSLEDDLKWDFRRIDLGQMTYEEAEGRIADYKTVLGKLLTDEGVREITGCAGYLHPETFSRDKLEELAVDMHFTKTILRFNYNNYATFHFYNKSIAERREFISVRERLMLLPDINTDESLAILDDKWLTYETFSDYFGRDVVNIESEQDLAKFESFFSKHDKAVIKPRFDLLGHGVRLMFRSDISDYKAEFNDLVSEYNCFIMEEFIEPAEETRALNPDSVNTVRIISYCEGEKTSIRSASMRIGNAGSFVDNVGAGGMTVSVDEKTGVINSNACDEKGFIYETHPDTGIRFNGYKLPAWDRALEVVYAISGRIPGAKYVGWDLACTDEYKWVIVEGNGKTGFFGAQAPRDIGRRREFLNTIGADPKGALYNEVAVKMAEDLEEKYEIPAAETMKSLEHFESLGLDGRWYRKYRAWELTDEECLVLREELAKREEIVEKNEKDLTEKISRKTGISEDVISRKYHLAKLFGYKEYWFIIDGIYMLDDEEIKNRYLLRDSEFSDDWHERRSKRYRKIKRKIREAKSWNKAQYRLAFLKARNSCGCAADEFYVYRIWDRPEEETKTFLTAEIKRKAWLANASTYEKSRIFQNKLTFSDYFSEFVNRASFSNVNLTYEEFLSRIAGIDRIVYKLEEGEKGIGMETFYVNRSEEENREVYERLISLSPGIVEEYLRQDPSIAGFYSEAVNTLRVITALKGDDVQVVMAAIRTGKKGEVDNWSQGGVSAGINVETGVIETDGANFRGKRYKVHPVGKQQFRGFQIPHWDAVVACVSAAARKIPELPFVGWDVAVLEDGRVALIEGNPDFGIKAVQSPYALDGIGLRDRLERLIDD